MNKTNKTMIAFAVVALPLAAQAGMGTMWGVVCLHMFFGNFFIGLVVGILLRRCCEAKKPGCLTSFLSALIMSCANIASSIVFFALPRSPVWNVTDIGFQWLLPTCLCLTITAYFMKMAVEFPFVYLAVRINGGVCSLRGLWKTSLVVQSVSFALIALYYTAGGEWSLLTIKTVDASNMDLPSGVVVKYVAEGGKGNALNVRTGETVEADADTIYNASLRDYPEEVRYVGDTNGIWTASVYASDGGGINERIDCRNKEAGWDFRIGFQTPFFSLLVDYVTMLPDGKVIFEMDRKVVVVDPVHNRMAVLAHGKHPVVEIEETSTF